MCGIAGIIASPQLVTRSLLERMAKSLSHRGPDDEGISFFSLETEKKLALGLIHRRLSIIDLSPDGHQPMSNEGGSVWITYNGEIYNYQELTSELKGKGYHFKSCSDTEVIISAYEEWGLECLQKLQGMFAFTIWDREKKIIFMAVDRFGIKPLYYSDAGSCPFIFASEVRSILNSGMVEKKIEPIAVDSFLAYGAIQAPLTIISKVQSLLPAHYLVYNIETAKKDIVHYWSPAKNLLSNQVDDEAHALQYVRDSVEDSVRKHLVSDVPVGLFLSGGIDSSVVVALANKFQQGQLQSFSVTFAESHFSEAKYSRLIAAKYCKNHREIKISENELLNILPGALDAMDQPTIDGINIYAISKIVKESGIKVVLSGQGGDEIFGGYSTFRRIPLIQKIHCIVGCLPVSLRRLTGNILDQVTRKPIIRSKVSQIMESSGDTLSLCLILRQLFSPETRKYLLGRSYDGETFNGVPLSVIDLLYRETDHLDFPDSISLMEVRLYLANMLLRDGDFMSMAHGLEVRVPFLNHHLMELVFGISSRIKSGRSTPKPLLVKAVADLLPPEIYNRPKMGFTFPWEIWLKEKMRSEIEELLNELPVHNESGLNMKSCQTIWQMFLKGAPGVTWSRVWAIYALLYWHRKNIAL